MNNIQYEKQKL